MKKQLSLIFSLYALIFFSSCDKTETFDDKRKLDNETQFAKISADSRYKKIESASKMGFIMYRVIESGNGETPYFTDKVKVLYTGWYKNDWSQEKDTYTDNQGKTIINKIIFDSTDNRNNIPNVLSVNPNASTGVIDGFSTALQHMKVGDKWEVWIPWKLAYGEIGKGDIKPYTTLVFEIKLVGIVK